MRLKTGVYGTPHLSKSVALPIKSSKWLLKRLNHYARMKAVADVSMENNDKTSIYKAHWYTKSKKEVAGDVLVCSCHAYLTITAPGSYTPDFFEP